MFQATRRRLALWYTTVTAVLLLLFATGFYLYVRSTLIERVDDTLEHVVEVVERSLVIEPVRLSDIPFRVNVEASFRDNADTAEDDHIDLEWFSPTGELLWSTLSEPLEISLHPNDTGETVHLSADHLLRQVTKRVQLGRYVLGYLRVSHPWFEVTKPIRQLIVDLTLGTIFMVMSVAAIGWFLSGLAMKPVRESYQRLKQFTADASHELRNPIAMIQTNVQVALADPDLDSPLQRQQLKVVERLTQRLGRLVNDLLFLARVDSGIIQPQWQPVPLDALLMEVIEEQQLLAAEKGISLSLHFVETPSEEFVGEHCAIFPALSDDAFTLLGDWDQLARLFTNLVSNALQYTVASTENPGEASVQVELQQLQRLSHVGGRNTQSLLRVQVRDTGIGISESALPQLFDRFYRVDPARKHDTAAGSGLGLAIAKAIIENHHGQIQVESILHQGTTVTVTFPVSKLDPHN
ncbi:sensor histidine kinase [Allocoleopsis franciscana]|uniref:histidine kinase n=1 Tax=Allocoleopsis franciscana PCC 7113 TaxID=1173027 RepID=K9WHJ8_9CYAN|nr:ATP-binding protein [Allocoleopsis franciscana]AFZ19286.1 signal transduction histidine kinase [Allocoleopsis franciscana PCC 7113]